MSQSIIDRDLFSSWCMYPTARNNKAQEERLYGPYIFDKSEVQSDLDSCLALFHI